MSKVAQKQASPFDNVAFVSIRKTPDVFAINKPTQDLVRTAFMYYSMTKRDRPLLWSMQQSDVVLNTILSDVVKINACKQREVEALREKAVGIAKSDAKELNASARKNSNKQYLDPEAHLSNIHSISSRAFYATSEIRDEMSEVVEQARKGAIRRIAHEIKPRLTLNAFWDAIKRSVSDHTVTWKRVGAVFGLAWAGSITGFFAAAGICDAVRIARGSVDGQSILLIGMIVGTMAGAAIEPLIQLRHYTAKKFLELMEQTGMLAEQAQGAQKPGKRKK